MMNAPASPMSRQETGATPAFQLRLCVRCWPDREIARRNRQSPTHLRDASSRSVLHRGYRPDEELAAGDQILALPTLVRRLPEPIKKIIGDLSNEERVLVGLDAQPVRT